jgi:uncharacterized protein (DUF169 family)
MTPRLKDYQEAGLKIERLLRLKTFCLGVKLVGRDDPMPKGAVRPKKDLGYHLSLCQSMAKSRREGMIIASQKEDMWCFEPVLGLGFAEPPQHFLEGHNRFPGTSRSLKAGKYWAQAFPRLSPGRFKAIACFPLTKATFIPDIMVVYCDPAQLTQLLMAANWIDGRDITCTLSGHAACVYSIVPVIQNDQFQITSPCLGDRKRALAQDDEIIFSAPVKKILDLAQGLAALARNNMGLPVRFQQMHEYELEESYAKIAKLIGLDLS